MPERIVLLKMGDYTLGLPFESVDEILGSDRAVDRSRLPEGIATDENSGELWVATRGRWLPVRELLPDIERGRNSQILVVTGEGADCAFFVEQVLGIESVSPSHPFPAAAVPFSELPFTGVHFLRGRPVLDLDLSRLISLDIRGDRGG